MIKPMKKIADLADIALDWTGLAVSVFLLVAGVRDYREGGSIGWPITGTVLVVVSLAVIHRGIDRRRRRSTGPRPQ